MALTQLADVFNAEPFEKYTMQKMLERSTFIQSGVAVPNAQLNSFLNGPGASYTIPFWNQLANDEANASDDTTSVATPVKLTTGLQIAIRQSKNTAVQSADLAAAIAGDDPIQRFADNVSDYWVRRQQAIVIASLDGVFADNLANDSGDMIYTQPASGVFTDAGYIQACGTLGEYQDQVKAIAVHPVVYGTMRTLQLIDYVRSADNKTQIATYQGVRVIVSAALTLVGGQYRTILFGPDAVALGVGLPKVGSEIERTALGGTGGGIETLVDRKELVVHPKGFAWSGLVTGATPSIATLKLAASWNRVVERNSIPLAFYVTTG